MTSSSSSSNNDKLRPRRTIDKKAKRKTMRKPRQQVADPQPFFGRVFATPAEEGSAMEHWRLVGWSASKKRVFVEKVDDCSPAWLAANKLDKPMTTRWGAAGRDIRLASFFGSCVSFDGQEANLVAAV